MKTLMENSKEEKKWIERYVELRETFGMYEAIPTLLKEYVWQFRSNVPTKEEIEKAAEQAYPPSYNDNGVWIDDRLCKFKRSAFITGATAFQPSQQKDAYEFAEWIRENYNRSDEGRWCKYIYSGRPDGKELLFTTTKLYELFQQFKK